MGLPFVNGYFPGVECSKIFFWHYRISKWTIRGPRLRTEILNACVLKKIPHSVKFPKYSRIPHMFFHNFLIVYLAFFSEWRKPWFWAPWWWVRPRPLRPTTIRPFWPRPEFSACSTGGPWSTRKANQAFKWWDRKRTFYIRNMHILLFPNPNHFWEICHYNRVPEFAWIGGAPDQLFLIAATKDGTKNILLKKYRKVMWTYYYIKRSQRSQRHL